MNIKRYNEGVHDTMFSATDGEWVAYADYETLQAKYDKLLEMLKDENGIVKLMRCASWEDCTLHNCDHWGWHTVNYGCAHECYKGGGVRDATCLQAQV